MKHVIGRELVIAAALVSCVFACSPTAGPDKTVTGAVLGAGWGAGAGAVVGNQLNDTGPGALLGSGLGAGAGLMTGIGLDVAEGAELEQQRRLDALQVQVAANRRHMMALQDSLDARGKMVVEMPPSVVVLFDENRAAIRLGAVADLQRFAETAKGDPLIRGIQIHGHSDDTGDAEKNSRLSEARARTIQSFLGQYGISLDKLAVYSHGATEPRASNKTPEGRQMNRRVELVVMK
jgi:outer membrane protein OmpA-like peptidoglycan-associated protein